MWGRGEVVYSSFACSTAEGLHFSTLLTAYLKSASEGTCIDDSCESTDEDPDTLKPIIDDEVAIERIPIVVIEYVCYILYFI